MELNKVYHSSFLDNTLPDKSVNLLIADPPYFEVKGEFDFIWSSMDDYLKDVEKWAKECKRLLADNGTLFWWGMDRKIAYSQIILDKYFELLGTLVWEKSSTPNEWETRRTFPERGQERFLMYSNDYEPSEWIETGLEKIKKDNWGQMSPFSKILKQYIEKGYTQKELSLLQLSRNGKPTGWISNKINFGQLPTPKQWELFCNYVGIENNYEDLRQEYEDLRQQYETERQQYETERQKHEIKRRPFNNYLKLTDIWRFSQQPNKYNHPTKKPEKLTRALILTCSRPNDLVFVPFAGSGTECAMAAKEGRRFVGFDIEKNYVDMANKRAAIHLNQTKLF